MARVASLLLLLLPLWLSALTCSDAGSSFGERVRMFSSGLDPARRHRVTSLFGSHAAISGAAAVEGGTVKVTDYGADPTGKQDSAQAFQQALAALLLLGSNHSLSNGIIDLGGAILDLEGGDYLTSAPIVIPENYGNVRVRSGTVRAAASFPTARYVIEVGTAHCTNPQASCNENIGFEDLMIDAAHTAAGCLWIGSTMGANVGPQMFFLGFDTAGLLIQGGHEVMVHESWFGEFLYSDKRKENGTASTAVGILINGNDHYVTNTIVFSSHIGVELNGAANVLTGVHTWNLAKSNGGTGILVKSSQNRMIGCYLDFNDLLITVPEVITVTNGFFLGGGVVTIQASTGHTAINGVNIVGNEFWDGNNDTVVIDERQATFSSVTDTVVADNVMQNSFRTKATVAHASLRQTGTQWQFDFSDKLLFNGMISRVEYSIAVEGGAFVRHTSRPPQGNTVVVETDQSVTATVYIKVYQGTFS